MPTASKALDLLVSSRLVSVFVQQRRSAASATIKFPFQVPTPHNRWRRAEFQHRFVASVIVCTRCTVYVSKFSRNIPASHLSLCKSRCQSNWSITCRQNRNSKCSAEGSARAGERERGRDGERASETLVNWMSFILFTQDQVDRSHSIHLYANIRKEFTHPHRAARKLWMTAPNEMGNRTIYHFLRFQKKLIEYECPARSPLRWIYVVSFGLIGIIALKWK